MVKFVNQQEAIAVDEEFFGPECGYCVEQLMELAGHAVACAVAREFPAGRFARALVLCGPGNNGGDGLVCARHLQLFGYRPVVLCPRAAKEPFVQRLLTQLKTFGVPVHTAASDGQQLTSLLAASDVVVDAVFGHSFKGPVRGDYAAMLAAANASRLPIVCVDVPSGWDIERGDVDSTGVKSPSVVVSLSAPKLCMRGWTGGVHYLGGRFVPPAMAAKLELPQYPGCDPLVRL